MGQWGKSRIIKGCEYLPHVNTEISFSQMRNSDIIDLIVMLGENKTKGIEEINKQYLGKPYSLWISDEEKVEMSSDTLILPCPICKESFPVTVYEGDKQNRNYNLDSAPLSVLHEVHEESKKARIGCIHCGLDIKVCVRFIAYCKPLSEKYSDENWREE